MSDDFMRVFRLPKVKGEDNQEYQLEVREYPVELESTLQKDGTVRVTVTMPVRITRLRLTDETPFAKPS